MKKQKDYTWLLLLIVLAIAVLASSCNTQPTEQEAFDIMWNDMVDNDSALELDWYNYIDTVQVDCTCFNCNDHNSGYIPPITPEQLNANAELFGIDAPEEMYTFGDTIALRNYDHNKLLVIHYHSKYDKEYYDGWDVYIFSLVGE